MFANVCLLVCVCKNVFIGVCALLCNVCVLECVCPCVCVGMCVLNRAC